MSKKTIVFAVLLLLLVIAWNIAVYYADRTLQTRRYDTVYDSCHKIWSSRGLYHTKEERNTLTSFGRAFAHGAHGAEVDFSYDVAMDRFIVGHGHPKKGPDGRFVYTQKAGGLLTLETLFERLGEGHAFWLDYKNLDDLGVEETEKAIRRLKVITSDGTLRERLYIEGSNPLRLSLYTDAGFNTILGIHPLSERNPFSSIVINGYKMLYVYSNITGIALGYGSVERPVYGEATSKRLGSIPVFLFHVPDDKVLLQRLVNTPNVRALLAGRDVSIDRFGITACGAL
jgi:hypothetical protein